MAQETILVVDDSPDIIRVLTGHILNPLGYKILQATDGHTGLELATNHSPDLIMLDNNMPQMTGLEVLTSLRQAECETPVILMSMHGSENLVVKAFRLGVRDYLVKPFDGNEVEAAINRALKETRLIREKEVLTHNLIAAEAVRSTTITLSHYINNHLMVVSGGVSLLEAALHQEISNQPELVNIITDSRASITQIKAVINVLQRVSDVQQTTYHGETKMIDIEAALHEELTRS